MKPLSFSCLVLVANLFAETVANAGDAAAAAPERKPLRLSDALARAQESSPVLAAFPLTLRSAEARRLQADQRPPPTLGVELEDALGSGDYGGFDNAQVTLSFSQTFELGGKRAARRRVADAGRASAESDYELARVAVAAGVTEQFIHVVGDQHQLALSRETVRLTEETLRVVAERVRRAAASPIEEKRTRIVLARARIVEKHHAHELETARRQLAAWWGAERVDFGEAVADLFARPSVPDYDTLVARIARSPELARWATEKSVRDAELRLIESRRRPDLTAGAGLRHFTGPDDVGLVFQFSMPLGTGSRAAPFAAEAQARRDLADVEQRETELRLRTALFGIAQELRHAETELAALEREILPEAEAALELARDGYTNARLSQLELLDAQRTLLELRNERITAAIAFHQFTVQIEKILGEPLTPASAQASKIVQP